MRLEIEVDGTWRTFHLERAPARSLSAWLRFENLPLNTRCGERGLCRACEVEVETDTGLRVTQSCQLTLADGMRVRIPPGSRLSHRPQVLSSYAIQVPLSLNPEWGHQGWVAAVDIGTTTISLVGLDLATGETLGSASDFNPQIAWGDDVLTRINLCRTHPESLAEMQSTLWDKALIPLARQALGEDLSALCGWVLSGNTTMLHLALGRDPGSMGVAPFFAEFLEAQHTQGSELTLGLPVRTLPSAAAYVGGDIVSGLVASGFAYTEGPALYVDVGTNGEIVFAQGGRMVGCATAAGPAFEGSGLSCGVRAGDGAISKVAWSDSGAFVTEQIGDPEAKPIGICGSAYIDFLAVARGAGLLSSTGRATVQAPVQTLAGETAFVLAYGLGHRPIMISEHDIARLLQAKAAIAAGIQTLMEHLGVRPGEVQAVYLAGGFGMHLNLTHAVACGLLPGFSVAQIKLIGNASLAGAHLAALDSGALFEMSRLASAIEMVELNLQPGFEDAYLDALML